MHRLLQRAWKLVALAAVFCTFIPLDAAEAEAGPCGYVTVQLGGSPVTIPLVVACTPAECDGLTAGPFKVANGDLVIEDYTCIQA